MAEKAEKLIKANPSIYNEAYTLLLEGYEKLEKDRIKLALKIHGLEYEGERTQHYMVLLQKLDHMNVFDGDLVRVMVER